MMKKWLLLHLFYLNQNNTKFHKGQKNLLKNKLLEFFSAFLSHGNKIIDYISKVNTYYNSLTLFYEMQFALL